MTPEGADGWRAFGAQLLEHTDDAIIGMDASWVLTLWGKGAERLYGWTSDEVLGRHVTEVARLDLGDEERAAVRAETEERGRWRGDVRAYRKDGTALWVELVTVAVPDDSGTITGYLSIQRDVTDRIRAADALRESRKRVENILESVSDAFIAVDCELRVTYVNERTLRRMRKHGGHPLTRDDVIGRPMWDVWPEVVGTEFQVRFEEALRTQRSVEFEAHFAARDQWFESRVFPSSDGLSIYYRDVTRRRRAAQELVRRARQQALLAGLGQRALVADGLTSVMDEAVALVAQALDVQLAGVTEVLPGGEAALLRAGSGWAPGAVGRETDGAEPRSLMAYTLQAREPVISADLQADDRFEPSAALTVERAVSAITVVVGEPGEPFGILGAFARQARSFTADDASFLQAVANVLGAAVARARAQARVITVRDAERLRIARHLHDDTLHSLDDAQALAAGLEAAPGEAVAPRSAELAATLTSIGQQLRAAIYELRLGAEEALPFGELLQALVAVHRTTADDAIVELSLGRGVPRGPLGARGTDVLRILSEALTNARRHAHATHVVVRVWSSGTNLFAEVSDDGRGFDSTAPLSEAIGTGIRGMRERAHLLHGRLEVRSTSVGTTVQLRVPLQIPLTGLGEAARVLLIVNHAAMRDAIAAAFEREAGFVVVGQAGSLVEARRLLADVDVAVLDVALPDGYGPDLIEDLRRASPGAQALVLSATLDRGEVARAVERGAAGVLQTARPLDEVVGAVRTLQTGESLMPIEEVVDLLRFAQRTREREHADRQAIDQLTPREREVLQALADGLDTPSAARKLHISLRTQRNHMANILAKLGVHSQLQALVLVLRYGVVVVREPGDAVQDEHDSP